MSVDEKVTKDLLETLEDGKDGFSKAADKLADLGSEYSQAFRDYAQQRAQFADELQGLAHAYGDDPDRSGSVAATIHRGWMTLKDALTKNTPTSILEVAAQGEEHAVSQYEEALDQDISSGLREVVERQLSFIRSARDAISGLAATSN